MSTTFGYATVSSTDQDLSQLAALKAAGCTTIRKEKRSATSMQGRQELKTLLEFLRKGDTLVVTRIDRLARSVGDLQDIVRALKAKGVALKATEQPIDTSRQQASVSWTCSRSSPSSRPICVRNGKWRGSPRPTPLACTRAASRQST